MLAACPNQCGRISHRGGPCRTCRDGLGPQPVVGLPPPKPKKRPPGRERGWDAAKLEAFFAEQSKRQKW